MTAFLFRLAGLSVLTASILCVSSLGAELTTTITEDVLNEYAAAIGPVTGSGQYDVFQRVNHCIRCSKGGTIYKVQGLEMRARRIERQFDDQRRIAAPETMVASCGAFELYGCTLKLFSLPWTWKVMNPKFIIQPSGAKFAALVRAEMQNAEPSIQYVQLPVTVTYDATQGVLKMSVSNNPISITFALNGSAVEVGGIDLGSYFGTQFSIRPGRFAVNNKVINAQVSNVGVQLSQGKVVISNEAQFF